MQEIKLADLDLELAKTAYLAAGGDDDGGEEPAPPEPEAVIVLLIPRGSPFELYAQAIVPGIAASQGRARAVRIDTTAEPEAPARFGLSGSPGLVLFINGKQMAAFAVPWAEHLGGGGPLAGAAGPLIEQALQGLIKLLPPGPGMGGPPVGRRG